MIGSIVNPSLSLRDFLFFPNELIFNFVCEKKPIEKIMEKEWDERVKKRPWA